MSLMSESLTIHSERLQESAGDVVTYIRGDVQIKVVAVLGQTIFDEVDSEGSVRTLTKSVDFLIAPSKMKINGLPIEPKRGDRIVVCNGDEYEMLPGSSTSGWSWSDAHKTHYRIHTERRVKS